MSVIRCYLEWDIYATNRKLQRWRKPVTLPRLLTLEDSLFFPMLDDVSGVAFKVCYEFLEIYFDTVNLVYTLEDYEADDEKGDRWVVDLQSLLPKDGWKCTYPVEEPPA